MAIRVRNSKIVPPQLPEIVHRPRLQRFVRKNKNKRLILIQGQAAQGKSTLAASCVRTILPETTWVNLAPEDSEASHLFHVLVHSFKQCMGWLDISKLVSYPAIDMGARKPRFRFREWACAMFDGISDPLYIVLDGLDRLDDDGSSLILIQELMGQAPAHIHFILLSREEPPLKIQKFRIAQQAAILHNEELAFNFDEICFFFNQIKSFDLSHDVLKKIHQITEGWVGGVVLISEHLDHLPVKDRQTYLFKQIPARFKEAVFQYFLEEVLRSQPTHMYEFLIRSSVFDIIEPKLVESVLKIEKCQEFLLDLNRKNLFVHSRYHEGKGWEFEYHQLFKEFLQSKFQVQVTENQKQDIYLNSGDLFEKTGDYKKAIEFYIQARAHDKAIACIEKIGMILLENGRNADQAVRLSVLAGCPKIGAQMILHHAPVLWTRGDFRMLEQMIAMLPEKIIDASPHLIFWHGMSRLPMSPQTAMERLVQSLDMFDAQGDPDGCFLALSGVLDAVYCQFNGFQNSDLFLVKVVQFETRFGKTTHPEIELKLTGAVLHSLIFRDPVSDTARKWIERGWKISQQIEDIDHAAPVFLPMILLRILQGNLSGAGHLLKRFEKATPETISPLLYLVLQSLKAFHAWLSGDFDAGLQAVEQGLAMEKKTGINLMFSSFRVQGAASAIGRGQYELAAKFLDEITPVVSHQGLWMQGWYHFVFAWLALVTGNPGACRLHALAGFEKLNQTGCEMALACCHLMMSKMHDLFNEKLEAQDHLNQSLVLCEKYGVDQCRFMALLTRASFLMDPDTDDGQAASSLRAGMRLGREQLYRFGFAWNPQEMAQLCAHALKRDIEPDYVRSLIVRYRLMPKTPPLEIRQWPWPVSLYCLGEFKVMVNEEMVGFSRKAQYKPLAMLKFIVARGGRHVPDYAVQDALWPDSDGDAAHNAFTTTLHRLRNLLKTPDGLIHREGSLSCNIRMIWADIWAFENICRLIENRLNDPRPDDRISPLLDDLLALYRGPFIPDEPAEWAIVERQRLKALFVDTIQKIARRFERQRRWQEAIRCYRLALNVESVAEAFYENLMRIYGKMGKPGEALLVYRQYKAVLQASLGLSPSSRMRGLCRAICGRASGI